MTNTNTATAPGHKVWTRSASTQVKPASERKRKSGFLSKLTPRDEEAEATNPQLDQLQALDKLTLTMLRSKVQQTGDTRPKLTRDQCGAILMGVSEEDLSQLRTGMSPAERERKRDEEEIEQQRKLVEAEGDAYDEKPKQVKPTATSTPDDDSMLSPKAALQIALKRRRYAEAEDKAKAKNILAFDETKLRELEHAKLQVQNVKHVERWLLLGDRAKTVGIDPLTPTQREIVRLVMIEGKGRRRYRPIGQLTITQWLSIRLNLHRNLIGPALKGLEKRKFVERVEQDNTEWLWLLDDLYWTSYEVEWRWRFMQNAGVAWPATVRFGIDKAMELAFEIADDIGQHVNDIRRMNKVYDQVLAQIMDHNANDLDWHKSRRKRS